jgi:8-oxo-dGTP pyrophosphatase MutT (NUDIX family)
MTTPKFNNVPNAHLKYYYSDMKGLTINQDYFISRAVAVVGVVFAFAMDGMYVLVTKRSQKMRDEAGKIGVPCGYLDWNETRHEAMTREVYEETSFYLPDYGKYLIFNNGGEPFRTKDKPEEDKHQNISHLYLSVFDFHTNMQDFPLAVQSFSCKETEWVKWMKLDEFYATYKNYYWAFNHDETIRNAVEFNTKFNKI